MSRGRLAALAVALAPALYFLPALLSGAVLCPDDGTIFNTPLRVAAAQITLSGSLPLWNPYVFSGMPLLGAAQGGLLFPPNWFYLLFSPQAATNLMVVSSYAVAGLGAYLYARRAGATVAGAVVTSLAWQWGGFLVGQISHINIVHTGAMLPWVLWALDGYGAGRGRAWGVGLAALVALQTFAGHQQTLAYSLLLVAAYAAACAWSEPESRPRYLSSLLFVAAGVLLAAVQILPTFELLRNSPRAGASYDFFTSFSMPPGMLRTFVAPYVWGGGDGRLFRAPYVGEPYYAELAGYVGVLGLMLAACAVVFRGDARTKFWAAAALVCLTLALGRYAPFRLYRLVYHVPVLNLFRVPARHLLGAEFALAVLAGRGLTALAAARAGAGAHRRAAFVGASVVLLTFVVVTLGRPAEFKLGRPAPVTLMRAPELFVPLLLACAGAWALWAFARGRRGAALMLVGLLAFDLALWGQSSGWRVSSPKADGELFREPETVRLVREGAHAEPHAYRILTAPHPFDPRAAPVPPSVSHSSEWTLWTQPDVYMMHGLQNAAGYDGFGLARYQTLAGEMKVWGELTDPDSTLRGEGREIDLLGVRFLVSMPSKAGAPKASGAGAGAASGFPAATQRFGDSLFAAADLGVPNVRAGQSLRFKIPPVEAGRVALVTNLSWSESVPDGEAVARLRLTAQDGRAFDFDLRAGADTSEWAHDRPDIRARVRHARATVATSYRVADAQGGYEGHTYVASFALPASAVVTGGEIAPAGSAKWPDLTLGVFRVSLADGAGDNFYPLRREWVSVGSGAPAPSNGALPVKAAAPAAAVAESDVKGAEKGGAEKKEEEGGGDAGGGQPGGRWRLLGRTAQADVYENARALPRAWLAAEERALGEEATLRVIRTGRLPEGEAWEPQRTALVEPDTVPAGGDARTPPALAPGGVAEVVRYEPNRVELRTRSDAPALLVLAENHYPGWQAYVDGSQVGVLRVDYGLRGVRLPAGAHGVTFVYRPKSALLGLLLTLLTAAALALWWRGLLPEAGLKALVPRRRTTRGELKS